MLRTVSVCRASPSTNQASRSLARSAPACEKGSTISVSNSSKSSLDKVAKGLRTPATCRITIRDPSKLQDLLGHRGSNNARTTRGRHKSSCDTTAFAGDFDGDSMWVSNTGTPVSSADGDDGEFCENHSASDGGCDFLGAFYAKANVAISIANDDKGLESGTLTSTGLFLYWTDLSINTHSQRTNWK